MSPDEEVGIIPSVFEMGEGLAHYLPMSPNSTDYLQPTRFPSSIQKGPESKWQGVDVKCGCLSRLDNFLPYDQVPDVETMASLNYDTIGVSWWHWSDLSYYLI